MKKAGFTLVEVLIAIILLGLAIASLVGANIAFTRANGAGADLSTAEFLTEQMRELIALVDYAGLSAFDSVNYSPPKDANGVDLNDLAYSQEITVENVSDTNFEYVVDDGSSNFVRITVRVFLNSRQISSTNWIRARY